jgi:hypothetical protein
VRYVSAIATLAAAYLLVPEARGENGLLVRYDSGNVRITGQAFRFLEGKPLESLRNGLSVAFDIQVSVLADSRQSVLRRSFERFVVSYDLWEERFSITRMRTTRASASHLTARAAEEWCLDKLAIPATGLPHDKPVWFRVDVRAGAGRQPAQDEQESDTAFSLSSLIELFSRPVKPNSGMHWRAESEPVVLAELRKTSQR